MCLPWTANIACKFNIPRITFVGISCFCHLCLHILDIRLVLERITSDSEYFVFPGLPDQIEITKARIPAPLTPTWTEFDDQMRGAEMVSYGVIMNSFDELEPAYVKDYKKAKGDKVWCIGPVSVCNKDELDKAER
ncbi:Glycosyltransferase [Quillaja saponaria]|uniref:Glycosyltransferase n=1 Tax=Quillaja saponaria TaxID=32244 RepID=A0AAD7VE81_QUISA|nr:Glycosyltransferase [Quillaja saponaria]